MAWLRKLLLKLVGKRVQGQLDKWGVSKTKLTAIVGVLLYAVNKLGPAFGHPVELGFTEKELLEFLGLWALRDGVDGQ